MKKIFLAILLLPTVYNTAFGIDIHNDPCQNITMPSAKVLAERLREAGFGYYDEKTKISQKLGGQEKHPFGIPNLASQTDYDFNEDLGNNPRTIALTAMINPKLIKILLKDHPEALSCIAQSGIFDEKESLYLDSKE